MLGIGAVEAVVIAQQTAGSERFTIGQRIVRSPTESAPVADITVHDTRGGETRRVEVPLDPRDIMGRPPGNLFEAVTVADQALLVIPGAYCKEVTVVGLPSGQFVDSFMGCSVSLSPDRTRVVYIYYPGRIVTDDVVVGYDFTRGPGDNASLGYLGRRFVPKGIVLFPPENRTRGGYETVSTPRRLVTSPFAWCGNDRISFLAATSSDARLVDLRLIEMLLPANLKQSKVITDRPLGVEEFRGAPSEDYPPGRPLPPPPVKELRYGDGCRSVTVEFQPGGPFQEEPATLPASGNMAR